MRESGLPITLALGLYLALATLWLLGSGLPAHAAPTPELRVCPVGCTYSSIQAAVDAANPGDVIKVAQGTYSDIHVRAGITQVVYISKEVTLRGGYTKSNWNAPNAASHPTRLDALGQGRVLVIIGTISPTVEGVLITGGDATGLGGDLPWNYDAGGGVYLVQAAATLRNLRVFHNTAHRGGGLYLDRDATTLSDSTVFSNTATANGGGVGLRDSKAFLNANTVSHNTSESYGGGLYLRGGYPTLVRNTVVGNRAKGIYGHGGGLYLYYSVAKLGGNRIASNTTDARGGGMFLFNSDASLSQNIVISSTAEQGGGLYLDTSNATLTNTLVIDNMASAEGSGLAFRSSSPCLLHTTIARNTGGEGSGVYITNWEEDTSTVSMTNTIIVSHTVGITVTAGNTATLNATLWDDNGTDYGGNVIRANDRSGDPAFAPDGYHLTSASAALDQGVDASVSVDIDGDTRPQGAGYDIGADELPVKIIYLPLVLRD